MKSSIVLIAILVLTGCAKNEKKESDLGIELGSDWPYFNLEGEFQSFSLDSVTSTSSNTIRHFEDAEGKEYLYMLNEFNNSIYKYSVESGEILDVYPFESEGPSGVGTIDGFDIISNDSLVVLSKYQYKLSVADISDGVDIKQTINLLKRSGDIEFTAFADSDSRIIFNNQKLILTSTPFVDPVQQELKSAGKNVLVVDLKDLSVTYKNLYTEPYQGRWPSHYQRINVDYNETTDRLVYTLPADSKIIEWDPNQDELTYHDKESDYIESPKPMAANQRTDEAAADFLTQNPSFEQILYDKYRDVYYQFVQQPFGPEIKDPSNGHRHKARLHGLIIMDNAFNVIKEVEKLTPNPADMAFVGKSGLYLKQFTNDEDILKFKILNFE